MIGPPLGSRKLQHMSEPQVENHMSQRNAKRSLHHNLLLATFLVLLDMSGLAARNTLEGAGDDVENAGDKIEDAVD